jgi:hypothetical protein
MKVTVFVLWSENRILTEAEFEKEIEFETLERFEDSDFFDEWLDRNFDPSEIFSFTESEKETHRNRYKEYCREEARMVTLEEYEAVELEI